MQYRNKTSDFSLPLLYCYLLFLVANFTKLYFFLHEAKLLIFVHALFYGSVFTVGPVYRVAEGSELLEPTVAAHLPLNRLAILGVREIVHNLVPGQLIKFALLHGFDVAVLLLLGVGRLLGEFFTLLRLPRLAGFNVDCSRFVVTLGVRSFFTRVCRHRRVCAAIFPTVKLGRVATDTVLYHLILLPAVDAVQLDALEVVVVLLVRIVDGVAHRICDCGAPLDKVGDRLVSESWILGHLTQGLFNIEALRFLVGVYDGRTIFCIHVLADVLLMGVARTLHVRYALLFLNQVFDCSTIFIFTLKITILFTPTPVRS